MDQSEEKEQQRGPHLAGRGAERRGTRRGRGAERRGEERRGEEREEERREKRRGGGKRDLIIAASGEVRNDRHVRNWRGEERGKRGL